MLDELELEVELELVDDVEDELDELVLDELSELELSAQTIPSAEFTTKLSMSEFTVAPRRANLNNEIITSSVLPLSNCIPAVLPSNSH